MIENWLNPDQEKEAKDAVMQRFIRNSVAMQFIPEFYVDRAITTVHSNRFDYTNSIVDDVSQITLYEPTSEVRFTKAQIDEDNLHKAMTTVHRAASALARWHDELLFYGFEATKPKPPGIRMKNPINNYSQPPVSLREAAITAAKELNEEPIIIEQPNINESLVTAAFTAILKLEGRGYFSEYHMILGEQLWSNLHKPAPGSLVLPKDRIEPSLSGGGFYRTTTLPPDEGLLISLDGPTIDCVMAGEESSYPSFEWLRTQAIKTQSNDEEEDNQAQEDIYLFRIRERFAPRVRENRAIVLLKIEASNYKQSPE